MNRRESVGREFNGGNVHANLTRREIHILLLLADGLSLLEIKNHLVLSIATVRAHIRNLQQKTGVHSLHQLTAWSFKHAECCVGTIGTRHLGDDGRQ